MGVACLEQETEVVEYLLKYGAQVGDLLDQPHDDPEIIRLLVQYAELESPSANENDKLANNIQTSCVETLKPQQLFTPSPSMAHT